MTDRGAPREVIAAGWRGGSGLRCRFIALVILIVVGLTPSAQAYFRPGETTLVSVPTSDRAVSLPPVAGELVHHGTISSQISANGRYVAFDSDRPDIVPGDTNLVSDIFVRDLLKNATERVSISSSGEEGRSFPTSLLALGRCAWTTAPETRGAVISADGRFVAFVSCFDNLVPGDNNASVDAFVHDRKKDVVERVNVSSTEQEVEEQASGSAALDLSMSADGRFVAFASTGQNLVEGDTNGFEDVFVRDLKRGTTERVNISSDGDQSVWNGYPLGGAGGGCPSLNADGRFVVFRDGASNLVDGDTNESPDIFVHDRKTGITERVSTDSSGGELRDGATMCYGGAESPKNAISGDGRFVVFTSLSNDVVPNQSKTPLEVQDSYIKDRRTGRIERVSVSSYGEEIRGPSEAAAISLQGRFVVFEAWNRYYGWDTGDWQAYCLGCGDPDIFVSDRVTGQVDWASVTDKGGEPQHCSTTASEMLGRKNDTTSHSRLGTISGDGSLVTFTSCADNLTPDDQDSISDIFLRQRGSSLGTGGLAGPPGEPDPDPSRTCITPEICVPVCLTPEICIPPDVRIARRDLHERASIVEDGADLIGLSVAYRSDLEDLFFALELSHLPSLRFGAGGLVSTTGSPWLIHGLRFIVDHRAFEVRATALAGGTFGLFECTLTCTQIADLRGGYGTTGDRIVFSVPLRRVGLGSGGRLVDAGAFTAVGTYASGATRILDRVSLSRP